MTQASHSAPKLLTERSGPDFGFYGIWLAAAIVLIVLPLIFSSGGSLTSFSLIGIAIIFALSYNILLGQTGLLSFGHADQPDAVEAQISAGGLACNVRRRSRCSRHDSRVPIRPMGRTIRMSTSSI